MSIGKAKREEKVLGRRENLYDILKKKGIYLEDNHTCYLKKSLYDP